MEPMEWCRRRYLVPGNPLTLTLPYADASLRDALLAVHAVCGEIAAVSAEVRDPEVARQKLAWWRRALAESLPHPAVQALAASGAATRLDSADLDALITAVAGVLEAPRFNGSEDLLDHCRALAGPGARMEACLVALGESRDSGDAGQLAELVASGYLVRLVRDLALDARAGRWNVPLSWQAEYQVSRAEVAGGRRDASVAGLVRHMLDCAVRGQNRAFEALSPQARWRHRHALLRAVLDRRLAARLDRRPDRIFRERALAAGPGTALALWRTARRLRRGSGKFRRAGL